jgi:hypothetical protein
MSNVLLGRNRFVECGSILSYQGSPVLAVSENPLRVGLDTRPMPSPSKVRIDDSASEPNDHIRVVRTEGSFAIFWNEDALAVATRLDPETVHLKLDLRPLGISIYDDPDGLHIGKNVFTENRVVRSTSAIRLG